MYFDADHDLAHEFYEETSIQMPGGGVKLVMRRIKHNLIPQVCTVLCVTCVHYTGDLSLLATQKAKFKRRKASYGFFNWPKNVVL